DPPVMRWVSVLPVQERRGVPRPSPQDRDTGASSSPDTRWCQSLGTSSTPHGSAQRYCRSAAGAWAELCTPRGPRLGTCVSIMVDGCLARKTGQKGTRSADGNSLAPSTFSRSVAERALLRVTPKHRLSVTLVYPDPPKHAALSVDQR